MRANISQPYILYGVFCMVYEYDGIHTGKHKHDTQKKKEKENRVGKIKKSCLPDDILFTRNGVGHT